MKVTREANGAEGRRRKRRTLGKLLSAFSRAKRTPGSAPSSPDAAVDVPRATSPRVARSSTSTSPSYGGQHHERSRTATGGLASGYACLSAPDQGAAASGTSRRRSALPDVAYPSYLYEGGRVPELAVDRRYAAEVTARVAAPNWSGGRPADRRRRPMRADDGMDILSFFDTGSVDRGYSYKCGQDGGGRESEGAVGRLLSAESAQRRQQLMLESKDSRGVDHCHPGQRFGGPQPDDVVQGCVDDDAADANKAASARNGHQCSAPTSFWYCEKMDKGRRTGSECEAVRPTELQQTAGAPAAAAASGGNALGRRFNSAEERRRLAKIGAIVLATAGVAALILLTVKYRRQAQACRLMMMGGADDDEKSTYEEAEDEGVCIFEKFDRVKCQNNNFKAMMTNSEKLVEHEDKVCASQDFRKVTKRLKDQCETRSKDIFCPCTDKDCDDIDKTKCFDNF